MKPIHRITGVAIPLNRKNIDTDVIISSRWLKKISREGMGVGAFEAIRDEPGSPLRDPRYACAPILIVGDNFGCGSSREHAAWALLDMGVRCVIAPGFSDIFSGNAFKNGILAVTLPVEAVDRLAVAATTNTIDVELETQTVRTAHGETCRFEIDPFRKHCLLNGLDEIGLTLMDADAIAAHEVRIAAELAFLDGPVHA